ncbi:MAG: MBL fold metallo-hydrolase [Beijerinckiaceae bacterium]|nr:MBL fold metallo-hydrolase [Beijerinckiaceae bacterium]
MSDDSSLRFNLAFADPAGRLTRLSPLVRRLVAPNPGPMTFTGTCTYVIGHGKVAVIDPGPALPDHIDALLRGLDGERVTQILVTHTHRDHSPGARLLQEATDAPIIGCAPHWNARAPSPDEEANLQSGNDLDHRPDRVMADGEIAQGQDFTLEAVATPGHTMNHLAFALPEENTLFSGDHVMAWSTSVIVPPSGSMGAYLESLEKLRGRAETIYWPGHGGPVDDPQRFLRGLLQHRRQREAAILARLRAGDDAAETITAVLYAGLDPRLLRAASLSVLAHLEDLAERGEVVVTGPPGRTARFSARD